MSLYLCIFDDNGTEVIGVEVGPYVAYDEFREAVLTHVEGGKRGTRCPVIMMSSDSDWEWTSKDSVLLLKELQII